MIAESDGKEEGRDGQSQDQDVREAFHEFPLGVWRSAEGRTSWGHEALRQAAGGAVAQFLEQTEFHLFAQIWIDTCEHISVEGAGTVPDVAEEEQQGEGGVAKGEPAAGRATEDTVGVIGLPVEFECFTQLGLSGQALYIGRIRKDLTIEGAAVNGCGYPGLLEGVLRFSTAEGNVSPHDALLV